MTKRRGQAALEFLTTYGWAFLVILVMIGALAYFGVLDPTRFIPQRCQFGQELYCERFALQDSTTATAAHDVASFELRNNLPDTLFFDASVTGLNKNGLFYQTDGQTTWTACLDTNSVIPASVLRNANAGFTCRLAADTVLSPGEKVKLSFKVHYSVGGSAYDGTYGAVVFGEVFANVA